MISPRKMSLKKIVTHIFIWTLPTNVATTGRDSPNGREFYAHSPLQKLKWEAGSARPDVKTGTCHPRWKIYIEMKAITIHNKYFSFHGV